MALAFTGQGAFNPTTQIAVLGLAIRSSNVPQCANPGSPALSLAPDEVALTLCGTEVRFSVPRRATDWIAGA